MTTLNNLATIAAAWFAFGVFYLVWSQQRPDAIGVLLLTWPVLLVGGLAVVLRREARLMIMNRFRKVQHLVSFIRLSSREIKRCLRI